MSVTVERRGAVTVVTLDRPRKRNAISRALAEALSAALAGAAADEEVAAVVLAANGPVWAAGGDLEELRALGFGRDGAEAVLSLGALPEAVEACPLPVVAAVAGPAFGGGAELLAACDVVVVGPDAQIAFVHGKMGLVPAWGGTTRLSERVGAARAAEILLTARPIGAEEAVAIGLAARIADDPTAEAVALASLMSQRGRAALGQLKRSLLAVRTARRGGALEEERDLFRQAWGGPAHRRAFAELGVGRGRSG
jgi:enoyl-CoA hydratase/carnithine racemase